MKFAVIHALMARALSSVQTAKETVFAKAQPVRAGLWLTVALSFGLAAPLAEARDNVLKIRNDRGGVIQTRVNEIAALRASGAPVDLGGEVCLSSCTMYLSLPNACVHRGTTFGFHGPSSYGRPLQPEDFEHWSTVMASHLPANLRSWYMSKARYEIRTYFPVKGAELIRMGVPECARGA